MLFNWLNDEWILVEFISLNYVLIMFIENDLKGYFCFHRLRDISIKGTIILELCKYEHLSISKSVHITVEDLTVINTQ